MDISYYKKYEPVFGVWTIKEKIGEGSYGTVFELEREDFGRVYKAALKAITIPKSDSEIIGARAEGMDEGSLRAHFQSIAKDMVDEFAILNLLKGNSNVVSYENHLLDDKLRDILKKLPGSRLNLVLEQEQWRLDVHLGQERKTLFTSPYSQTKGKLMAAAMNAVEQADLKTPEGREKLTELFLRDYVAYLPDYHLTGPGEFALNETL